MGVVNVGCGCMRVGTVKRVMILPDACNFARIARRTLSPTALLC
jgi:hypothetical protein